MTRRHHLEATLRIVKLSGMLVSYWMMPARDARPVRFVPRRNRPLSTDSALMPTKPGVVEFAHHCESAVGTMRK